MPDFMAQILALYASEYLSQILIRNRDAGKPSWMFGDLRQLY